MSEESFESWYDQLGQMDFETRANIIKTTILEKVNLETKSKRFFTDCFDYFMKQYKIQKPIDLSLLKIYLRDLKGWSEKEIGGMIEMTRMFTLLSMCGFEISKYKKS